MSAADAMLTHRYGYVSRIMGPAYGGDDDLGPEIPMGNSIEAELYGCERELDGLEQDAYAGEWYGASEAKVARMEKKIERLEGRLENAKGKKKARLQRRIGKIKARLDKLEGGEGIEAPVASAASTEAVKRTYPVSDSMADEDYGAIGDRVASQMFG